ncbi:MAG: hypothetical protein RL653_4303 [Pseudomonadota bacterium]
MNTRLVLVPLLLLSAVVGCQCGAPNVCATVKCGTGLVCEPETGACVPGTVSDGGTGGTGGGVGGGTGGGAASCSPACSGTAPICDEASGTCKACTSTQGCAGETPFCDLTANGGFGRCMACTTNAGCSGATPYCDATLLPAGRCVACRSDGDCSVAGQQCDLATRTCISGGTGGGAGGGGGTGGGTGGGGGGGTTVVTLGDGGTNVHCLPGYVATPGQTCTTECPRGFECLGGECVLRGQAGEVQVTLRFNQEEDLDLHVVEPQPGGSSCDIYYGNPNAPPGSNPPDPCALLGGIGQQLCYQTLNANKCDTTGWLDLDSNPACKIDGVKVENVIYPSGQPAPKGTYIVRVAYYQACTPSYPVPYEVEVRANGQRKFYCGEYQSFPTGNKNAGGGDTITTFTLQ